MYSTYSRIASEYYDSTLHPTCANLNAASRLLIGDFVRTISDGCKIVEVGCGRSQLAAVLGDRIQRNNVLLTDSSVEMLQLSQSLYGDRLNYAVADAGNIPVKDGSVDYVVSSLGDPYNTASFWSEVNRALRINGTVFFTTPSYEWATSFRQSTPEELENSALFVSQKDERLYLPSIILSEGEQVDFIQQHRLKASAIAHFDQAQLSDLCSNISPKIQHYLPRDCPVVTAYQATRLPACDS